MPQRCPSRTSPDRRGALVLACLLALAAGLLLAGSGEAAEPSRPAGGAPEETSRPLEGPADVDVSARQVNVLLLYAAPRLLPSLTSLDDAFRSTLAGRWHEPVTFYTEYLDLAYFTPDQPRPELGVLLQHKYAGVRLDLVLAVSSRALRFAMQNRAGVLQGAPIVFTSVDRSAADDVALTENVTGTWLNVSWAGTLDVALRLQPETREVMVITGTSGLDRVWQAEARRQLERYASRVQLTYLTDLPLVEVERRVARLTAGTIVLLGPFTRDTTGQDLVAREVYQRIPAAAAVPAYGPADTMLGAGIVGGHLLGFEAEGRTAADLAVRVLRGERPPPAEGASSSYVFDARQLQRWNLDEARLPVGSVVRFRAPSLWATYGTHIIGAAALVAVQSALIVGLLVNIAQRRRARRALAERLRFETLLSELSARLGTVPGEALERRIDDALRDTMEALDLDRVTLAQLAADRDTIRISHSVTRPGVPSIPPAVEIRAFPWIARELRAGRTVSFADTEALPAAADADRQSLRALRTRSMVAVPMVVDGAVVGALACSTLRGDRAWPAALVQRIRLLAEVFANALARQRAEDAARESEERFRLLADSAPLMIWMSGQSGERTYFNRGWLDVTGRPLEDELGGGWTEGIHREDLALCLEQLEDALAGRRAFTIDYRLRRWDGEYRWVLDHGLPRDQGAGTLGGYIGAAIDVTELKGAQQAIRESAELRSAIFGSLHGQVAALDREGVVIAVNHAWRLFAEANGADTGRVSVGASYVETCRQAARGGDPEAGRALEAITSVLEGGGRRLLEYVCRTPWGERWFEMEVGPFHRPEGGAIVSHVDVTRRRQAEDEARQQREELAHALRVTTLGELAASLAHEINQPLAAIVTNAQAATRMLGGGREAGEDVTESLTDIASDAKRASHIIRQLRALFRKEQATQKPVDLNALVEDVITLLHHDFGRKRITVRRLCDPRLPMVSGDSIQLQQVLLNLLVNASEALALTTEGPREITIETSRLRPRVVAIAIRDTGIGVKDGDVERIFQRFVSSKPDGLGMGLSISRSIVEAHGGTIRATANADRGLTLHVELHDDEDVGRP
jgi:PAS domain S-box-containing protein